MLFFWISVLFGTYCLAQPLHLDCPALPYGVIHHCTSFNSPYYSYVNPAILRHGTTCNITCPSGGQNVKVTCIHGKWEGLPTVCIPQDYKTDTHLFSRHRRDEKEQLMALLSQMGGNMSSLAAMFAGRTAPTMDENGPMLTCPPTQHEYADSLQITTKVSWDEPSAVDSEDGQIKPKRYGPGPGWTYSEGFKSIAYLARDKDGNLGKCEMNVTVEVVRCKHGNEEKIDNGYYSCHPTPEFVYGATCEYGCYQGYELTGNKLLTCEKSGKWSHAVPKCKTLTCPVLKPFTHGSYSCTDSNNYKSLCTYTCKKGYIIKSGMSRVRVCIAEKRWRGKEPICVDQEPPRFENCPASVSGVVETGSTSAKVSWEVPNVRDNSLEKITPKLVSKIKNNDKVKIGAYDVVYEASDSAGNKAKPCRFKVIVKVHEETGREPCAEKVHEETGREPCAEKELSCPVQYALPFMKVSCPSGTRLGAKCTFSCQAGWILNGTETSECLKSKTVPPYASWDWPAGRPVCQVKEPCPKPEPPTNGALACDLWEYGRFCQMQCMKGTDIPPSFTAWKLFVCSDSGKWNFNGKLPPCEKTVGAHQAVMSVSMNYYEGKCPDPNVQKKIKNNFLAALRKTPFAETWKKTDCKPDNVKVLCGKIRQKRSANGTQKVKIEMKVDIKSQIDPAIDIKASMKKIKAGANGALKLMESDVKGKQSKLLPYSLVPKRKMEVSSGGVELNCPEGTFPSYRTYSCVGCTKGTFLNPETRKCEECARGYFQPISGQKQCVKCPNGKTTIFKGAILPTECHAECKPGTFSKTGTEPCLPCEMGYFQPNKGGTSCRRCPGGTTTLMQGSTTAVGCEGFGIVFAKNGQTKLKADISESQKGDNFVLTFWLKLSTSGESDIIKLVTKSSVSFISDDAGNLIIKTERQQRKIAAIPRDKWTYIHANFTLSTLYVTSSNSSQTQISFNGSHFGINETLDIEIGGKSFEGSVYQLNVWTASSAPRTNSPPKCDHKNTGDIVSWTDFAAQRLDNATLQAPSTCDDTDECSSSPCIHGTCEDGVKSYHCECQDGFKGDNCDVNIDECENHMCEHGATCIDGVRNYTCKCTDQYTGKLCEDKVIDGVWGKWGEWRECPVTCGGGARTRGRRCDSPAPSHGGKICAGKQEESEICNKENCPECVKLKAPEHGSLRCDETAGLLKCHVTCKEGYAFETKPRDSYECGAATGHEWNFRSVGADQTALPRCIKVKTPKEMKMAFMAGYGSLVCGDKPTDVISVVTEVAKREANSLLCQKLKLCAVKGVKVHNCDARERKRRDTGTPTVSFTITIANIPGTAVQSSVRQLNGAYTQLSGAVQDGKFDVDIGGKHYKLAGKPRISGGVTCEKGLTKVDAHCIPCAPGTYFHDEYCEPCDMGHYQPEESQLACLACPSGKTTRGKGASLLSQCSVTCKAGHYLNDKVCTPCKKGEYQDERGKLTCKPCPQGQITPIPGATSIKQCMDLKVAAKIKPPKELRSEVEEERQKTGIFYYSNERKFPIGIVIGVVGIACLCVTALTLIACKIRHNRFNRIQDMEIDSQLQAIARAVTYIAVPITGIKPKNMDMQSPHKKDI